MNPRLLTLVITTAFPVLAQQPEPASKPDAAPAAAVAPAHEATPPAEPLAGVSNGTVFLRSPDNFFQLFPNGRLQIDGYAYDHPTDKVPTNSFLVKRARLELFGWVGPWVGFNIAGDFAAGPTASANPVAPSAQSATDVFLLFAPWKDVAILQVGQFDAPFTLENRTSDKYFDFIERSNTVRAFGIPSNKEVGAMVHGLLPSKLFYYSVGVFNGDGQNFRNVDTNFDVMGRAWVAPLAFLHGSAFENVTIGGSAWLGQRGAKGLPLAAQQTAGGFRYFGDTWTSAVDGKSKLELHQHGALRAFAVELDAPIAHRYGVRFEAINKHQELGEDDAAQAAANAPTTLGHATLDGWAMYGQAWAWLIGDDTIVGRPGLQLPGRFEKFGTSAPRHGLQVLARVEHLDERLTSDNPTLGNPQVGRTTITSLQLGATYWYTKRFRAMLNYGLNHFAGDSTQATTVLGNLKGRDEHEVMLRLGIAL